MLEPNVDYRFLVSKEGFDTGSAFTFNLEESSPETSKPTEMMATDRPTPSLDFTLPPVPSPSTEDCISSKSGKSAKFLKPWGMSMTLKNGSSKSGKTSAKCSSKSEKQWGGAKAAKISKGSKSSKGIRGKEHKPDPNDPYNDGIWGGGNRGEGGVWSLSQLDRMYLPNEVGRLSYSWWLSAWMMGLLFRVVLI